MIRYLWFALVFITMPASAQTIYLTPQQFGAVCDGGSHPLSGQYGSLAAAQAVYPFAVSLTQQFDYVAFQKMSNTAFGAAGSEHSTTSPSSNIPVYIPQGNCQFGNDTWRIANTDGGKIVGAGTNTTTLNANGIVLQFDGLWYSHLIDFTVITASLTASFTGSISGTTMTASGVTGTLAVGQSIYNGAGTQVAQIVGQTSTGTGGAGAYTIYPSQTLGSTALTAETPVALDIDGNTGLGTPPNSANATIGTQGDRFDGLLVSGGGGPIAVAVCRQGGGGGQCSEMTWNNFHGLSTTFRGFTASHVASAIYYQNGFNALGNVFVGGDMQGYEANGVYLVAGSVKILGTSFESTTGYTQIVNSGCDVNASQAGAEDAIILHGSRSESLSIYCGAFSQWADITAVNQNVAAYITWAAGIHYALNTVTKQTSSDNNVYIYRVTTAGTSGGSPPLWPTSGTVTDGGITWTLTNINAVSIAEGWVNTASSHFDSAVQIVSGSTPGVTACGSGPTVGPNSTRYHGSVTEGSGGTGCVIGLNNWFQSHVNCVVSVVTGTPFTSAVTSLNSSAAWILTIVNPSGTPTYSWNCWE